MEKSKLKFEKHIARAKVRLRVLIRSNPTGATERFLLKDINNIEMCWNTRH